MALVLDLTRLLPGPLAARVLLDMGFEVVRLESPQGDMMQQMSEACYTWLNRGKRVHTLDLKTASGVAELKTWVAKADVLLDTNRVGVMERLGVGYDVLKTINPKLTYVRIAGFRGENAPGHDLNFLAEHGLQQRFPWQDYQFADTSGAFWAVIAAQQGLLNGGGFYEVYLAESALAMAYPALPDISGDVLCYGLYPCQSGTVALGCLEEHFWHQFCNLTALNLHDKAYTSAKPENPEFGVLQELFLQKTARDWEDWAKEHALPLRAVKPNSNQSLVPWFTTR